MSDSVEERAYLSIGEVLALLKEEFPDVTISKIRFLESQGLLDPERTPSGYRKFYDTDVERLQWILRQQREHFLPLKVIKGRLRGGVTPEAAEEPVDAAPAAVEAPVDDPAPEPAPAPTVAPEPAPRPVAQPPRATAPP
ncbi:MAG TPA: MerR family transcriptional regulator, partial [Acidimicrobiales bacterium]|nr:MerR family transcriptional regulator [Acidimicrobiales bacterium]